MGMPPMAVDCVQDDPQAVPCSRDLERIFVRPTT